MPKVPRKEEKVTDIKIRDKVYCEILLVNFKGVATLESCNGVYFPVEECGTAGKYADGDFFRKLTKLEKALK